MAVGTLCYPSPSPSVRTSSPNQVVRRFAGRQLSFSVVALVMVRNASWPGRVVAFHYCSDQGFRSSRHSCNTSFPYLEGLDGEELGSTYAPCVVFFWPENPWSSTSRPVPVHVPASIKIVGIVLSTLRAFSFVILFTHSANDWFRRTSTERSPLFLSSCCNQAAALKNLNLRV